jgi:hypothetical protein
VVTLSTTEAELVSATSCAQSLLFHYRLLTDIGLSVKLPMVLEIDNKDAKDLICNWSAGGRIRHVNIRQYFLRDLKEDNMVKVIWIPTLDNSADVFTKNLYGPLLSSVGIQISFTMLSSFKSRRKYCRIFTCLIRPPALQLQIRSLAPLLSISRTIGNLTESPISVRSL